MTKLIIFIALVYLVYRFVKLLSNVKFVSKQSGKRSGSNKSKYAKMNIQDAEFEDIEEDQKNE